MKRLNVVLFSGGRGSRVLSQELLGHPGVRLTLAINGYDDGKSTGEIRRFLGGALGPSDFRKNAHWLARQLGTCPPELVELLAYRFPPGTTAEPARDALGRIAEGGVPTEPADLGARAGALDESARGVLRGPLSAFLEELGATSRAFEFSDCSLGNLVFAGSFLGARREFNAAIRRYSDLLGLPREIIQNVTDGTDAYLVGLTAEDRLLASEAEIVDSDHPRPIKDIFLIDRPPMLEERRVLASATLEEIRRYLREREANPPSNPILLGRLGQADLVIYAPGTQHSSLFPSYFAPGIGHAIATNLGAIKLLVTNIQRDAETGGASAIEIIDRAVYYLRERGRLRTPVPCLITHYLINDPAEAGPAEPYVFPGALDSLEDPRLVRIGSYEEGVTGRHDALKVVAPYVRTLLAEPTPARIAILLLETDSLNKVSQTILEMLRGGLVELPVRPAVYYRSPESLDPTFVTSIPFPVHNVHRAGESAGASFSAIAGSPEIDYVVLFESSGMYLGQDVVKVAGHLAWGGLDAVWGSRRLSVAEIRASYRSRYGNDPLMGTISYVGSHLLSLGYLLLYGKYVSDALSGVRAVRAEHLHAGCIELDDRALNQRLLTRILRPRGELLETPVQFLPLSADRVRRTTVWEGLRSLGVVLAGRFRPAARKPA